MVGRPISNIIISLDHYTGFGKQYTQEKQELFMFCRCMAHNKIISFKKMPNLKQFFPLIFFNMDISFDIRPKLTNSSKSIDNILI